MSYSLEERLQMMIRVGRRFNIIAIPSLIILIGTGIYNSYSFFNNFELLFSTSYGNLLTIKIILVMALIINYIINIKKNKKKKKKKIMYKKMTKKKKKKLRSKIIILGEI